MTPVERLAEYQRIFDLARVLTWPQVDAFETSCGYAIDADRLNGAARILACPLKVHPPHWQHGRVIYSAVRRYLADHPDLPYVTALDIGTAKGFSALCARWAITDAGHVGEVTSVDVIDPTAQVSRNTVAEVGGLKTLAEILAPWPEAREIVFRQAEGIDWLETHPERIHVAFVDGKHTTYAVRREGVLLAERQEPGDLVIFDDMQIGEVSRAVVSLHQDYRFTYLDLLPHRSYAVGIRR